MKKIMLLTIAGMALASCTQNYDRLDELEVNSSPSEIKLYGGVQVYSSVKSIFNPNDEVPEIQFIKLDGETPSWEEVSTATTTGKLGTGGAITFTSTMYYPNDETKTQITAFYPAAKSILKNKASMEITGAEDVLYASSVSGTKKIPISSPLTFNHLLTQFKFVIQREAASTGGTDAANDIKNVKITVKDANTAFTLNLTDGSLSAWGTAKNIPTSITNGTAATTASAASTPLLLEPGLVSITLSIEADGYTPQDVTIQGTTENTFKAGYGYTITLTFKGKEIDSSGVISEWTPGTATGDVK